MTVAIAIGIAYMGGWVWQTAWPHIAGWKLPPLVSMTSAMISNPSDGTSVIVMHRIIRYSALEEESQEDLITAATLALPSNQKNISALSYIVTDLTHHTVVSESQPDRLLPIASLTKLVTAVIAKRLIDPSSRVTLTGDIIDTYGNTASFRAGEIFQAEDLFYPLLLVSSNDAAEALAKSYGRKKFIQAMNDFTQSIGAYRTYFDDPSGLSANNVSTASDMTRIIDWIRLHDPSIIATTALKSKTVRGHTWTNPTRLLNWSSYIGGKNGYIPEAANTTASLFAIGPNKNLYAVVLLGSRSRDADIIRLLDRLPK